MNKQEITKTAKCPFCEGDLNGCCFCDHSGRIYVGEDYLFKNEQHIKNSLSVKFLKEQDEKSGLEIWPEMIEYFLEDKNIPKWYSQR